MSQPDADGGKLDGGEEVLVPLVVACCDGSRMLELVEEVLHQSSIAIEEGAEGTLKARRRLRLGIGLMAAQAPLAAISTRSASGS